MEFYLIIAILLIVVVILLVLLFFGPNKLFSGLLTRLDQTDKNNSRIESTVRDEVKTNRQELTGTLNAFQASFLEVINTISKAQLNQLKIITDSNRDELARSLKEFQTSFDRNVESFNNLQKEKFGNLEGQAK